MRIKPLIVSVLSVLLWLCCGKTSSPSAVPEGPDGPAPQIDTATFWRTAYKPLKVMSFNILVYHANDTGSVHWNYRKPACVAMIKDIAPDIIGLQECLESQFKDLLAALPEYEGVSIPKSLSNFGTCILWRKERFSCTWSGFRWYSDNPSVPSPAWPDICDDPTYRTYIWADLHMRDSDAMVYVYDTHFPRNYTADAPNNEARLRCSQAIVDHASGRIAGDAVVFAAGDFNCSLADVAGAASLAPLCDWMISSRESLPADRRDDYRSQNAFNTLCPMPGGRNSIDQIYYRNVLPVSYRTVWQPYQGVRFLSDHYPVLFECQIECMEKVYGQGTATLEGFPEGADLKS